MFTEDQLMQIMPDLRNNKHAEYCPLLQKSMVEFEITSYLREAAFLAQIAHESLQLRYFHEIASGTEYEGRRDLGNTQPGDGTRYKGRGVIMITGRYNYALYGKALGLDLLTHPDLAATPEIAFRIAGLFWKNRELNALADARLFKKITVRINGGLNGIADRTRYYIAALRYLATESDPLPSPAIQTTAEDEGLTVILDGTRLLVQGNDTSAWLDKGVSWVPLRPLAEHFQWTVQDVSADQVQVLLNGKTVALPCQIMTTTGYVPVKELAQAANLQLAYNPTTRTVTLDRG